MLVTLIQNTPRYAFKERHRCDDKAVAKGTVFLHAILPTIHTTLKSVITTVNKHMITDPDCIDGY